MKYLFLFFALLSCVRADTYTVYMVRSTPGLLDGASGSDVISRLGNPDVILEIHAETDGNSAGYNRTHEIDFTQSWDDTGKPASKSSKEVGTKFLVTEDGDRISFSLSHTSLDQWISPSPGKLQFQPLFQTQNAASKVVLKKGATIVTGRFIGEEIHQGESRKFARYIVIARR